MTVALIVVAVMWVVAHILARIEEDAAVRAEVKRIRERMSR